MSFEITNVESMQWNRTCPTVECRTDLMISDLDADATQISPEILADVESAIRAEIAHAELVI